MDDLHCSIRNHKGPSNLRCVLQCVEPTKLPPILNDLPEANSLGRWFSHSIHLAPTPASESSRIKSLNNLFTKKEEEKTVGVGIIWSVTNESTSSPPSYFQNKKQAEGGSYVEASKTTNKCFLATHFEAVVGFSPSLRLSMWPGSFRNEPCESSIFKLTKCHVVNFEALVDSEMRHVNCSFQIRPNYVHDRMTSWIPKLMNINKHTCMYMLLYMYVYNLMWTKGMVQFNCSRGVANNINEFEPENGHV